MIQAEDAGIIIFASKLAGDLRLHSKNMQCPRTALSDNMAAKRAGWPVIKK